MSTYDKMKAYILEVVTQRGDLVMGDDGYYVFWPQGYKHGYQTAESLRILADILDEKNATWDAQVRKELGKQPNEPIDRAKTPYDLWW